MKEIYQNGFGKSWFDEENQILHEEYAGMVNQELAMEIIRANLAFGKTNDVKGIIVNITRVKGTFTKLNEFLEKEYFPYFLKNGALGATLAVANDVFMQFSAKDLLKRLDGFEIRVFDSYNEAERWIHQKVDQGSEITG